MFEGLATEIYNLDIVPTRDAMIELAQLHHRLGVRLAQTTHAFSSGGSWGLDGAVSAKGWMLAHAGFSPAAAAKMLKCGRTLERLSVTTDAALNGTLSSGQLDAILNVVGNSQVDKFADAEAAMLPLLTPLDARRAAIAMRHWKATVTTDDETEPDVPAEGLHLNNLPDGSYLLNGTLGEGSGNTISEAIRVATTDDVAGEPERTPAQRRADALADICQFFLDHHATAGPVVNRTGMVVVADLEVLERRSPGIGTLIDGRPLKRATLDRIACDADVHRMIVDGRGRIFDFGRRTRLISDALRLVVSVLDQGCRFPDCGRPISLCQVHHVIQWTDDGPTEPSNLVSLCLRHHQILHQSGWHAKLLPDRTFEVTMPSGRTLHGPPPTRRAELLHRAA